MIYGYKSLLLLTRDGPLRRGLEMNEHLKSGENFMIFRSNNTDASFYYHENAALDIARMDSSAVYGNLADAMKNATVLFPSPQIIRTIMVSPPSPVDGQVDPDPAKGRSAGKTKTPGNKKLIAEG